MVAAGRLPGGGVAWGGHRGRRKARGDDPSRTARDLDDHARDGPALQEDRRARKRRPDPPRLRLIVRSADRRDQPEGPPGRTHPLHRAPRRPGRSRAGPDGRPPRSAPESAATAGSKRNPARSGRLPDLCDPKRRAPLMRRSASVASVAQPDTLVTRTRSTDCIRPAHCCNTSIDGAVPSRRP